LPEWINILKAKSLQKPILGNAKLKGLGVVISLAIVAIAIFALTHVIKKVDYNEVLAVVSHTAPGVVALALLLVACSYGSLTIYDLLALRTIGRTDVPYRIAALASFTSYPVAHGIGAVALISPVIRYRIYSSNGLGPLDVANICFLTGLTFWLGNLTAFGLSVMLQPDAISQIDYLPLLLNRWLAAALLLGVAVFLFWTWRSPRNIGSLRWPVRLPSGPMVLLQIVIGIFDLGAAALAMYVLIPPEAHVGLLPVAAVFIVATLLGFASHAPAGLGVFDATILIGLGGEDKEPLIAALLMFRLLYHVLPFVLALGLFGAVEGWRSISNRRIKLEPDHPSDDQRETQQADRIGRLAVEQHAHDDAADRADAGPDRVGCAERQ
jgi:glycosyltransferase 2 family protein